MDTKPLLLSAITAGDPEEDFKVRSRGRNEKDKFPRFRKGAGGWTVWHKPVPGHRYVMAVDVASGGGYDYSAIQIVSVDEFKQMAEFQGKIPPTVLAVEVYRAGRVFNDALAVPEITGGYGVTIDQELKRLHYPRLYTRKIMDRLSRKWTDATGWDTTTKTRMHMLDTLDRVLREQEFGLFSMRTLAELGTFVYTDTPSNKPEAQQGTNDDLVVSLAIAVKVVLEMPRELRKIRTEEFVPQYAATGW